MHFFSMELAYPENMVLNIPEWYDAYCVDFDGEDPFFNKHSQALSAMCYKVIAFHNYNILFVILPSMIALVSIIEVFRVKKSHGTFVILRCILSLTLLVSIVVE